MIFQSTLPIQGETNTRKNKPLKLQISIHSPYTGRDYGNWHLGGQNDISIHSPYTGRDVEAGYNVPAILTISIHSPYTGRDGEGEVIGFGVFGFQSTLPIQGETVT